MNAERGWDGDAGTGGVVGDISQLKWVACFLFVFRSRSAATIANADRSVAG